MEHRKEDIALIKKYLSGALNPREMYELERRAQQDPLLMDLMEGMAKGPLATHETNLNTIDALIKQRVQPNRSPRKLGPVWIAAASLVFAVLAIGFWLINKPQEKELIANQVNKAVLKDTAAPVILSDTVPLVATAPRSVPAPSIQKRIPTKRKKMASNVVKQAARPAPAKADTLTAIPADNLLAETSAGIHLDTGEKMTAHTTSVAGTVIDEETRARLPGVVVRALGLNRATTTDDQGRFSLDIPKEKDRVEVSYIGYEKRNVLVGSNDSVQIAMVPDHAALDEVVVVGYGNQTKSNRIGALEVPKQKPDKNIQIRGVSSTAVDAVPIVGWDAYKAYLNKEAAVFNGHIGTVRLVFDLDVDGKPTNIRIKEGGNEALEQRAIDIVQKGSAWKRGSTEVEIDISITFEKP